MVALRNVIQAMVAAVIGIVPLVDCLAQAYPLKAVRFVIPDAAGGGMDTIGRIVAEGLSEALGAQVVVDNRPGAGTTLGIGVAAKSPADGYTMLLGGSGFVAAPSLYQNLPFDVVRDFSAVTPLATSPQLVVAHPSLPVKTLRELITLAKSKPGYIVYASAGTGSSTFFATELFKDAAGIELVHVPYRGGGPALTAVMSGETPIYFAPVAAAMPHLQARLRAIAVTALKRLPMLNDVPTVAEYGFKGFEAGNSYGLLVPAGTPSENIAVLHRAAISALGKLNKRLNDLAYIPNGNKPEEYAAQIKLDVQKVSAIYQRLGLRPN